VAIGYVRNGKQAEPASQDRRPRRTLDEAPSDHHSTSVGERDQHAGNDKQRQSKLKDLLSTEDIAQ
jgi:hypothetical protein